MDLITWTGFAFVVVLSVRFLGVLVIDTIADIRRAYLRSDIRVEEWLPRRIDS